MDHILSNKAEPVSRFGSVEVNRGYRVIICLNDFSKEFHGKCIKKNRTHTFVEKKTSVE